MTAFTKLSLLVRTEAAEACAAEVASCDEPAPLAVTSFEDRTSGGWIVDAYFDSSVGAAELEPLVAAVSAALGPDIVATRLVEVPDEDWTAKVQRDLAPVRAGRFVIHGSHDRKAVQPARWAIEIDAGQAFGTAHHETTRGCLEAIDRLARGGRRCRRIADIGCGSGVLAIAAAKAWPAARVRASDNDPVATAVAADNARLSRSGHRIIIVTAAGLAHATLRAGRPYDLILANILAAPLVALAPDMSKSVRPGGHLVLSGLLNEQSRGVLGVYLGHGMRCRHKISRGEWMTLVLERARP